MDTHADSNRNPFRSSRSVPIFVALVGLLLMGCGESLGPLADVSGDRIRRQRAIWEAQQIDDYVFETRRLCFCGFVGWLEVTVQGDVVQSISPVEDPEIPEWVASEYPTVNELFDLLDDAVDRDAAEIEVTWHETLGYPESFWIDYSRNVADEELGHDIRALSPIS